MAHIGGFWGQCSSPATLGRAIHSPESTGQPMSNCDGRLQCAKFAGLLAATVLTGCGAEPDAFESTDVEPTARLEQPVIPGASISQVTMSFPLAGGGQISDKRAVCPVGAVAVGGGYLGGSRDVRVRASTSVGANWWSVSAVNLSATNTTVTVAVECLTNTPAVAATYTSRAKTIAPGSASAQWVVCPAGTILSGGGFSSASPDFEVTFNNYGAEPNAWNIQAKNKNNFNSITFQTSAQCLRGVGGGWVASPVVRTPSIPPGGEVVLDSAECPQGTLLGGGGFLTAKAAVRGSIRNFDDPRRWRNTYWNPSTTTTIVIGEPLRVLCLDLSLL